MIDFSSLIDKHSNKPAVQGEWFTIQWTPDMATGERLNIGVCFKDESGSTHIEVLEYFERVQCLYSQSAVFHLRLACEVAKEIVYSNRTLETAPYGIHFISKGYAQGSSADDVINSLFKNTVPLAIKKNKPKERAYYPISRERLYNIMDDHLKKTLELHEYFAMIEPTPVKRVHLGNQVQSLYIPFKAKCNIGTIASAAYSDENVAKCHLYDAQRDLSLALANFNEYSSGAIFILSPGSDLKVERRDQVDLEIDKFCWYLKTLSVKTEVDSDPINLADKAAYWYRNAA
ncbi:hypothetical protein AUM47_03105 [Cronobacter malonaticus]|uniref:hypothetical protein n=1 Tax=Cronobacter malonaticus TaxID=413503 RepID=UPI0005197A60|nr:hypothetical protein [Cronobacter malonaticus]EGT4370513.1 hypothetical protein [Cronobacter malonaticus]MDI6466681.1 hypothetical protein [Cronobacter malonaticus]HAU5448967.1 hypothetical protein [Cronobacter malonaticus]